MEEEKDKGGLNEGSQMRDVSGFIIESSVPIPRNARTPLGMALEALLVGESFLIPGKTSAQIHGNFTRFAPKRFKARTMSNGCRVWRVE